MKSTQERLVAIVEDLVGFDDKGEKQPAVFTAKDGDGRDWIFKQHYQPVVYAGFAITITGAAWAVLFEDNVILDSEQEDLRIFVGADDSDEGQGVNGRRLEDAPDDVIKGFLIAQAKLLIASTQRVLDVATDKGC